MAIQYLDVKQRIDIEPAADRNVERITDCCLDVSLKSAYFMGQGRSGGAWWMIWMAVACVVPALTLPVLSSDPFGVYAASLRFAAIAVVGFGLSLFWPITVWRNQLPMRFSRKTRKVYCYWEGETLVEDWDTLRAHYKTQGGVTAMGAPTIDPQINIEFRRKDGSVFLSSIIGVDKLGLTIEQQGAAFWEYIRRYMEEGPQSVPAPRLGMYRSLEFNELYRASSPFPILKNTRKWVWPFEITLFFPTRLVWFLITYPTDLLYYFLAKHVKVKPFPPEMEEACNCGEALETVGGKA